MLSLLLLRAVFPLTIEAGLIGTIYHRSYFPREEQLNEIRDVVVPIQHVCGDNRVGIILFGGISGRKVGVSYDLRTVALPLQDAPFPVTAAVGTNQWGPAITNGTAVAYLNDYRINRWEIVGSAPITPIMGIAGDNTAGLIIYGGKDRKQIARLKNTGVWNTEWSLVGIPSPFEIEGIMGDNAHGVVIYGGPENRNVSILVDFKRGRWESLPAHKRAIKFLSGSVRSGPMILDIADEVYSIDTYLNPVWSPVGKVKLPGKCVVSFAGDNFNGPVAVGNVVSGNDNMQNTEYGHPYDKMSKI